MLTILIVDDEKEIVDNIYRLVSEKYEESHMILKTSVSRAAKEILQTQVVDILLSDIRMPCLNGFDLARIAKENNDQCKIIFLTGFQEFDYVYEAIKLGCSDFVLKINSDREILETLEKNIEEVKQEEEKRELLLYAEKMKQYKKPVNKNGTDPVKFIKNYIWKNLDKEITLNKLARMVYLNPSYLSRLFRQETGVTITEYLLEVKIQQAKELLWETDLKIQDIALKLGIDSSAYFGRIFKKAVGCTPQEYRNQNFSGGD